MELLFFFCEAIVNELCSREISLRLLAPTPTTARSVRDSLMGKSKPSTTECSTVRTSHSKNLDQGAASKALIPESEHADTAIAPLTYLGDAFQYRTADGKFNSVLHPHLGQAGAPYAKTVPSKTAPLGALPDPGDIFDKLMSRQPAGRQSASGLSSMLIYVRNQVAITR